MLVVFSIKFEVKIGVFFFVFLVENIDVGWLLFYFLSNLVINSWVGEELRMGGIEVSLW